MKKTIFRFTALACMAFSILNLYGQETDKKTEKAKDNLQDAKIEVVEANQDLKVAQDVDFQEFKKESDKKFTKNKESISDLKIKILKIDEKNRAINQKRLDELELKNINLQKQLTDYKVEGPEKWATFKSKFNYEMDDLVKALKNFTIVEGK